MKSFCRTDWGCASVCGAEAANGIADRFLAAMLAHATKDETEEPMNLQERLKWPMRVWA